MACSLKTSFSVCGSSETLIKSKTKGPVGISMSIGSLRVKEWRSKDFMGKPLTLSDRRGLRDWNAKASSLNPIHAQASICISKALRWWEKTLQPNMIEIHSAQELVDSLLNADDKLVIVDFYSPGCGGCKTLHTKICQLAESNPKAIFLSVNYEELRTMCHGLHIHVLPFFRFYRGAEGRLCSFSCTTSTIKKFKDALAKYGTEGCTLGPAKGLDESELLNLASIGEISKNVHSLYSTREDRIQDLVLKSLGAPGTLSEGGNMFGLKEESTLLMA